VKTVFWYSSLAVVEEIERKKREIRNVVVIVAE